MIQKQEFIESLVHELQIIKHLSEKITPGMLDYKPTEKQRTFAQLLDYMGKIYHVGLDAFMLGAGEASFGELWTKAETATLENFPAIMDMQIKKISEKIDALTEEQLGAVSTFYGSTGTLASHLLSVHKWASAYKMQMFLYLKSAGLTEIDSMNLWAGMDAPVKE